MGIHQGITEAPPREEEGEMMVCEHSLADMDTAAHWDGACAICLGEENAALKKRVAGLKVSLEGIRAGTKIGWIRETIEAALKDDAQKGGEKCERCGGSGRLSERGATHNGKSPFRMVCPFCGGTGRAKKVV